MSTATPQAPERHDPDHPHDHEHADAAGAPLDLLLAGAALPGWQRVLPPASSLKFAAEIARHPVRTAGRVGAWAGELARVAAGRSQVAPAEKDKRFADPAWAQNPVLRRVLQSYLATTRAVVDAIDAAELDPVDANRVHAALDNLADALAPSNHPLINPRALKAVVETGGGNFVEGARRLGTDLRRPPRVPRMVEPDAYVRGVTVAATPGQVVARTEQYELIQYTPTTDTVRAVPLLIVPPTINKYYVVDMSPGRSLVEYLVGQGHQVFTISWRNPDAEHADWDADTYGGAILSALATARGIAGTEQAAMLALCSGGILASMVLGHLAARGELGTIAAAALSVTVLDQRESGLPGALLTPATAAAAVRLSAAQGYLDGRALAEVFAWLRPNDLVWSYWIESYLLGRPPRPFDVLFWNADSTRMTAGLHRDFIDLAQRNALVEPGAATMLGSPVDLGAVDVDTYVTAGIADHLCPWHNCYATTGLYGGECRFVLSTSGHIASIVNPPGNPKAHFDVAPEGGGNPPDGEDWLAAAETVQGSWWPDFSAWLHARTGDEVPAPRTAGDDEHPPLVPAPGTYVFAS